MISFLRKILILVGPHKKRLVLGIICGILGGLANPLLMVAVKISMQVVFPGSGTARPLVEIPVSQISSNRLSPALIVNPDAPRITFEALSDPITNWPRANWTGSNNLTVTLDDGTNSVTGRYLLKGEESEAAAPKIKNVNNPFSALSAKFKVYYRNFQDYLKEVGLRHDRKLIFLIVLSIPLAMLLRVAFTYLNTYFMTWVSIRVTSDLRTRLFAHVVDQPISFFNKASTADLMTVLNHVPALQGIIGDSLVVLILQPVTILGLLFLLLTQHRDLTLVSLLIFPVCVGTAIYFGRRTRRSSMKFNQSAGTLNEQMHETFTAVRVVKAYNLEGMVLERFKATSKEAVNFMMRLVRAQELPSPVIEFAGSAGVALFFMFIASKTGTKPTSADFTEFIGCIFLMYAPMKSLIRLNAQLAQAQMLSKRMFEILDTKSTIPEPANPVKLHARDAEIHLDDVSFSYGHKPVLKNIQLTIKPGQLIAFVGQTGSGKTTLTHLLLRFYDPQSGAIRIGGTDIRNASSKDLRDQIAVVTQEVILFNDTIRRNIEIGRAGATEAEIIAAAKHAHAHDFIIDKPKGYNNPVGEKGNNLSGGQRQRIAIARAILRNAPILILDEATNSLDAKTEHAVQEAFDELMQGRTTFCVAHKLSTIIKADLIVVMHDGCIIETGTHEQLLKKQGAYHGLYKLQFPG